MPCAVSWPPLDLGRAPGTNPPPTPPPPGGGGRIYTHTGAGSVRRAPPPVAADQRRARAQSRQRCRTVAGAPDRHDPASRPLVEPHLADGVEVEVARRPHRVEQPRQLPAGAGEPPGEQLLLGRPIVPQMVERPRAEREPGLALFPTPAGPGARDQPARRVVHQEPAVEVDAGGSREPHRVMEGT